MLDARRLQAIGETQNEIVATALKLDAVMAPVVERARALVDADVGVVELAEGDEMADAALYAAKRTAGAHR